MAGLELSELPKPRSLKLNKIVFRLHVPFLSSTSHQFHIVEKRKPLVSFLKLVNEWWVQKKTQIMPATDGISDVTLDLKIMNEPRAKPTNDWSDNVLITSYKNPL